MKNFKISTPIDWNAPIKKETMNFLINHKHLMDEHYILYSDDFCNIVKTYRDLYNYLIGRESEILIDYCELMSDSFCIAIQKFTYGLKNDTDPDCDKILLRLLLHLRIDFYGVMDNFLYNADNLRHVSATRIDDRQYNLVLMLAFCRCFFQ